MKVSKKILGVLFLALVLILAAVTNPSSIKHISTINNHCPGNGDIYAQLGLTYHNYILFSRTVENNTPPKTASVGLFGKVIVIKDFGIIATPQEF
ncbi:MAG: hypothetical protein JWO06_816 [Bacteroidota bacterium]|nr:hypothetical protein [Bacteroidota bacterium]